MSSGLESISEDLKKLLKLIPHYYIQIGVFAGDAKREKVVEEYKLDLTTKDISGVTNAELMFIHENGSPIRHIPKRPVLQLALERAQKELVPRYVSKGIIDFIETGKIESLEKQLNRLCVKIEADARWIIRQSNLLTPNAPSTIAHKKSDRPLLDTGQLANSIRCRLKKD